MYQKILKSIGSISILSHRLIPICENSTNMKIQAIHLEIEISIHPIFFKAQLSPTAIDLQ